MNSTDDGVTRWVNPAIRAMQAYHVADSSGLVKLDAMENPYPLPADIRAAWLRALQQVAISRYPDPDSRDVKSALKRVMSIPAAQSILLGNGSDEIIQMIMLAVMGPDRCVLAPEPGFVMYPLIARLLGLEYVGVPLRDDYSLDAGAMLRAIAARQPAVVFIASPNNPTGNRFDRDVVLSIIEAAPGLVVIDEAYFIFSGTGLVDLLGHYGNLVLMRTLSKLGLAGLRVGFLAGPSAWLQELDKIRLPYNLNVLSRISAEFFLDNYAELEAQAETIKRDRSGLYKALHGTEGIRVYPSAANFLLFRCLESSADELHRALLDRGVLVKNLHGSQPMLDQCLRVTVGTAEENQAFLDALHQSLAAGSG
ncbi:MAG: histidinol-phosphate transaminase [Thiotrichales bacterium]|nr:histidinol-phosphate transaminase [Thiotrichales bacterium]